jgi:hypothetical protein
MKITCHIDRVEDYPPPLSHLQVTLYATRDPELIVYEAKATCSHIKEIGQTFAMAYFELLRQVGENAIR